MSTATSIVSPFLTRERGPNRPTMTVFASSSDGRLHLALLPDVARQLTDVLGQRRRSVDLEVRDDLRAERLAKDDDALDVPVLRDLGLQARVLEALRTDAQHDRRPTYFSSAGRALTTSSPSVSDWLPNLATSEPLFRSTVASTMFIAGEPMKPPTKRFTGCSYSSCGRRDLLQLALAHHRDPVAHRHRLDLVVGDVDRRHAELVLEARDLGAHVDAELRVEVRERLVHQVRLRLADDRAAHRHPLALSARERPWLPVEELLEAEDAGGSRTRLSISSFGILRSRSPKAMFS